MPLHRVQMDVMPVHVVVLCISNAMIGKTTLPDLSVRSKFLLGSVGEPALDQLNCPFQGGNRCNEQVKMIRHQNEFVQKIGLTAIRQQRLEKEPRPPHRAKKRATLPRIGSDKVGLRVV